MIVMKFGGTSCGDVAGMRNITRIVADYGDQHPVVVVSAIARGTNELEQIARTASLGDECQANELAQSLIRRHKSLIAELLTSGVGDLNMIVDRHAERLTDLVKGIATLRNLTTQSMDAVCCIGELLSSRIVAEVLAGDDIETEWVDARDFMLTDDNFGRARPIMDQVKMNLERVIRPILEKGKVPVTQGFIGVTESGEYTTMGRESSDYSATIIGGAMNAREVVIWTDVDGILTADPLMVDSTRTVRSISFEEAVQLSHFGAKILHPTTMMPLLENDIPMRILNSRTETPKGTVVESRAVTAAKTLKSIAHKKNVSIVSVSPLKRHGQSMFWESVLNVLTKHQISVVTMTSSEYSIALLLDDKEITVGLVQDLEVHSEVGVKREKACICLVGEGVSEAAGISMKIISALDGIDIFMMSSAASDSALALVVGDGQLSEALKRVHSSFLENVSDPDVFDPSRE